MKRHQRLITSLLALLTGVALHAAADWPQILGPTRNGVYAGPPLAVTWPAGGPKKIWQKAVGEGFAGPVVAGDRLILLGRSTIARVLKAHGLPPVPQRPTSCRPF